MRFPVRKKEKWRGKNAHNSPLLASDHLISTCYGCKLIFILICRQASEDWERGAWVDAKTGGKKIRPQLNLPFLSIRYTCTVCYATKMRENTRWFNTITTHVHGTSNAIQDYLIFILKKHVQSKYNATTTHLHGAFIIVSFTN